MKLKLTQIGELEAARAVVVEAWRRAARRRDVQEMVDASSAEIHLKNIIEAERRRPAALHDIAMAPGKTREEMEMLLRETEREESPNDPSSETAL